MNVTVSIPDNIAFPLAEHSDISRQMLESLAIESYRQELLSLGQVAEMLRLSVDEANAFLKRHQIPLKYSIEDMEHDQEAIEMFLKK